MNRRHLLMMSIGALISSPSLANARPMLRVLKTATCGCCAAWVDQMTQAGFTADISDLDQDVLWTIKERLGISSDLAGCHTAFADKYFIEGHVPPADVHRLLEEKPDARGLTVPGMPMGSPGMETSGPADAFDVFLVLMDGSTEVFAHYR